MTGAVNVRAALQAAIAHANRVVRVENRGDLGQEAGALQAVRDRYGLEQKRNVTLADVRNIAKYAEEYHLGNCGEIAAVAFCHLLDRTRVRPVEFVVMTGRGDHTFVVAGRPAGTPASSCGPDVLVCDPWLRRVYPLAQAGQQVGGFAGGASAAGLCALVRVGVAGVERV